MSSLNVSPAQLSDNIWVRAGQAPPVSSSTFPGLSGLQTQVDAAFYRPCAAPGVVARRLREDGVTYYVLKNPARHTYLKLSESDFSVWKWMDGSRTVKDLVIAYFRQFKTLALGRITSLVKELKQAGFLTDKPISMFQQVQAQLARRDWTYGWRRLAAAFVEHEWGLNGVDAWMASLYQRGGWLLFTPAIQIVWAGLTLAGLVSFLHVLSTQRYTIVMTGGSYWLGLALLWLANFGVIVIHEHAHGLATRHFGREVRRGGFLIYYGMPAFFVDTMDIWMEPKRRRIAVTWAGPYSGLIVGGLCGLVAALLPLGLGGQLAFKTAFVCYLGVLINLNPLLELDGYFILIDWLGIPNLRDRSFTFVRTELWPRLKATLASTTSPPGAERASPPVFNREEVVFTAFGLLAAGYALYTLVVAVYFWQTRFSLMLIELWQRPSWVSKLAAVIFGAGVSVPVGLVIVLSAWNAGRRLVAYLKKRHFFAHQRNVDVMLSCGLAVIALAPLALRVPSRQVYLSLMPVVLMGLAVLLLITVTRQHAGARYQYTFGALASSAALLMGGLIAAGGGASTGLALEQLAALPLLVASFQSLLQVDIRHTTLVERLALLVTLGLGFLVIVPTVRWTADRSLLVAGLAAGGPYLTLLFVAALIPTLATCAGTRFFTPWLALVAAAALNGALCIVRLAPGWPTLGEVDGWLRLVMAGLWALGSAAYVTAGLHASRSVSHWSQALLLSESERLRGAFEHFFDALFSVFYETYGTRRAKAVDDDLDVIAIAAGWDVQVDSGRIVDKLDLTQIAILAQADRYRDVLARTLDLMDDWAGAAFIARATQIAYDSLPWPERETLGQYVLAGSPWGGAIAGQFNAVRSERYRLLQQVPLLADCNNRALAMIMAAVKSESVPAGALLGRQGAPVSRFVIVQSGAIEKWVRSEAGTGPAVSRLVGVLRRGASLGSEAFMGGGTYTGTYRAAIATDVLVLSSAECANLMRAGVRLASQVGQILVIRQLLAQMPLFASLGPQQLDALAHRFERCEVEPGQVIIRQGQARHHFYILATGQVEVCATGQEGQDHLVARLGPGQHFGETALYQDVPYTATCRAIEPTVLLMLDEPTFDAMVGSSQQITHYVEQVSSGRTIDTRRKLGLAGVM